MFKNCNNSKNQGDTGLGSAIAYFTSIGICVSIPLTDSQDYDLVVDIDGELKKVQVKTTSYKNPAGNYVAGLKICGGNSKANFISKTADTLVYDFLYVLTEDLTRYFIPREVTSHLRSNITLGGKYVPYQV